jgi:catechol 2,3-dioxygenase-like lactoylglutathione lyase family enzyme
MIDHTGVTVSDFEASKAFYVAALAAIGCDKLMEFGPEVTGSVAVAGFGEAPKPDFWTRTTMAPSCSISTGTTSRSCAMTRRTTREA